ncbi:metallophosphoesterase family protein [Eubacterium sp. MSJ-21]|nr:metallophosphoesterase family protein [Eubacterium sp. MSJ-21]
MKFAHIADVHLGTRKDTPYLYDGFLNFIDYIELHPVDMIFITGDLFDHVPTKEDIVFVDTQLARLTKTDILYVTGECDYLGKDSVLWNYAFVSRMYLLNCEDIHNHVPEAERAVRNPYAEGIVDSLHFAKYNVDVYGICQYSARNERNDFDSVYARNLRAINIFLGHGGSARVCPFDAEDFGGKNFGYVGLGHKHQYQAFEKQHVYYPGSLEPITDKETGEHGFIYGYIDQQLTSVKFVPIAMRRFEEKKEETPEPDYELLQELNRENDFGKRLQTFDQIQTGPAREAKKKYAAGMLAELQDLTGKKAVSTYTPTQIAEAWAEQQKQLKAELQSLQQGIARCEETQAELSEKLLDCPDQTGTTNVLHEDIGKLKFDLSKLEFEDKQVDKKYSRRRIGFVLWIDTPLAIVLSLLVTVGMVDVFFMQAWNVWWRLVTSLIGFEIVLTFLGFCIYNMTKKLRKKLFGTEIPVETHARLQSDIRFLESKIHDLELEESSRFLDQKKYEEYSRSLKEAQVQYQQLLDRSEVNLLILNPYT